MEKRLTADLNVVSNSNLEIQLLDGDLNIIQKLDDEPNDVGGLTSAELKAKFDESGNIIKKYINETLIPSVLTDDATEESRKQAEAARVAAEQGRVTAEEGRVSAESGRVSAEQARANAEASRVSAESARVQAETARADETAGIVARATAQANAAAGSASQAAGSEQAAQSAANTATSAASSASQSAAAASGSASQAQASAAAAAQSAASVDGVNKTAQSWAVGGTGTRPGEDTNNAKYWAGQAQAAVGGDFATKTEAQGYVTEHNQSGDAHADIRTAVAGSVRYDAAQSLSDAQKTQARGNIGALALVTGNINLYVSPSGNDDTGDGSSARPYRTIQHAVDAIPPVLNGHSIRINVSPGTYEEDVQIVGKACMSGYRPVEIRGASDLDGAESYQIKSLYVAGVGMGTIAIKGFKFLGNTTNGFDVYSYGDATIRVDSCIMDAANDNGVSLKDRPFAIAQIVDSTISNKKKAAVRAEHGCIALVRGCTGSNNAVAFAAGYDSGFGGCIVDCGSNSISATTAELKRYGGQIFK